MSNLPGTTQHGLHEYLKTLEATAVCFDGFEDSIIGAIDNGDTFVAVYSLPAMVQEMVKRDECHPLEALEFIHFNTAGSNVPGGPIILDVVVSKVANPQNADESLVIVQSARPEDLAS